MKDKKQTSENHSTVFYYFVFQSSPEIPLKRRSVKGKKEVSMKALFFVCTRVREVTKYEECFLRNVQCSSHLMTELWKRDACTVRRTMKGRGCFFSIRIIGKKDYAFGHSMEAMLLNERNVFYYNRCFLQYIICMLYFCSII